MDSILDNILLLVMFLLALLALIPWSRRRAAEGQGSALHRQAAKIKRQLDLLFSGAHRYGPAPWNDLTDLDHDFYDAMQQRLERLGFRSVGDVEDLTATEAMPEARTIARGLSGDEGCTAAILAHIRVRGWMRLFAPLARVPRDVFAIEFRSELSDGRILMTDNTGGLGNLAFSSAWLQERLPRATPPEQMLDRHRERLHALLASSPEATVLPSRDRAALEASSHRAWTRASRSYQEQGGLSEGEWIAACGRDSRLVRQLYAALGQ